MPVTEMGTPCRVYTLSLFTFRVRVFNVILKEVRGFTLTDLKVKHMYTAQLLAAYVLGIEHSY